MPGHTVCEEKKKIKNPFLRTYKEKAKLFGDVPQLKVKSRIWMMRTVKLQENLNFMKERIKSWKNKT